MGEWSKSRWIDVLVFAADVFIIIFACYLTQVLTYITVGGSVDRSFYVVYTLLAIFMLYAYDMYFSRETRRADTMMAVFISMAVAGVGTFFAEVFLGFGDRSIISYFIAFILSAIILSAEKLLYSRILKNIKGQQSILIIDSVYSRSRLARKIKYSCNDLQSAWYILINDGETEDIERAIKMMEGNDCVFISPALSQKASKRIFTEAVMAGKGIYQIPTLDRVASVGGKIVQFGDTPAVEVNSLGLTKLQKIIKRIFDICASLIGFIIASPIMLICAVAIKLDSKGPVFYKQERYTIHKKKFNVYKFRTMREDAEKYGAQLATEKDPRITRVGGVLRALRLDELPQILNILSGSMSIVGPRPERPVFADEYSKNVDYYDTRYAVQAGLTGYAQVYGKYNTRVSDKILMDMVYITQYSFWLDIKLILLTIKVMFTKESTEGVDEKRDRELNEDEKEYERIIGGWDNEQ